MEFNHLEKYVGQRLDSLTTLNVYNRKDPIDAGYPCLIFMFDSSSYLVRTRGDWIITLDYWDNQEDSTTIIAQSELIKAGFDYYWQSETEGFYQSHIIFAARIPDEKPNISRFQQRYLLKVRTV